MTDCVLGGVVLTPTSTDTVYASKRLLQDTGCSPGLGFMSPTFERNASLAHANNEAPWMVRRNMTGVDTALDKVRETQDEVLKGPLHRNLTDECLKKLAMSHFSTAALADGKEKSPLYNKNKDDLRYIFMVVDDDDDSGNLVYLAAADLTLQRAECFCLAYPTSGVEEVPEGVLDRFKSLLDTFVNKEAKDLKYISSVDDRVLATAVHASKRNPDDQGVLALALAHYISTGAGAAAGLELDLASLSPSFARSRIGSVRTWLALKLDSDAVPPR